MNASSSAPESTSDAVWQLIERERSRDRFVRRASAIAWGITFIALLVFAVIIVQHMLLVRRRIAVGVDSPLALYDAAMPLVAVVGVVSLLVATLTTVGIFLRLRTASLSEIQLRLAALEEMLQGAASGMPNARSAGIIRQDM